MFVLNKIKKKAELVVETKLFLIYVYRQRMYPVKASVCRRISVRGLHAHPNGITMMAYIPMLLKRHDLEAAIRETARNNIKTHGLQNDVP